MSRYHRSVMRAAVLTCFLAGFFACASREQASAPIAPNPATAAPSQAPSTTTATSASATQTPQHPASVTDAGSASACQTPECDATREAAEFGMQDMMTPDWPGPYFATLSSYADAGTHSLAMHVVAKRGQVDLVAARNALAMGNDHYNQCYDAGLRNNPSLRGPVEVEISVAADAKVSTKDASSEMPDNGVTRCVVHVMRTLRLPVPRDGRTAVLHARIAFSP